MVKSIPVPERLALYSERQSDGCWRWTGAIDKGCGYGRMTVAGKCKYAHRVSYETFVGPVPTGLVLDHLCRNRWCVNPEHLEPVTNRVNVVRSPLRGGTETHCPQGHPYSGENLYAYTSPRTGNVNMMCRTCRTEAVRRHRATKALSLTR